MALAELPMRFHSARLRLGARQHDEIGQRLRRCGFEFDADLVGLQIHPGVRPQRRGQCLQLLQSGISASLCL